MMMRTTQKDIQRYLTDAVVKIVVMLQKENSLSMCPIPEINIERPKDLLHGDWTTNIGFLLAKLCRKSPNDIASIIASHIDIEGIEKSVSVGGYINFVYTRAKSSQIVDVILEQEMLYGHNLSQQNAKILVEHSSPNLFKAFHVGHLVNNAVGESITRLMKSAGADVCAIAYPSDVSLGIAKAVWSAMQRDAFFLSNPKKTIYEKMIFAGECYADGTQKYDANEENQAEIRTINKAIYSGEDCEARKLYEIGKKLNMEYFVSIAHRLGSSFDGYIFESETALRGKEIVLSHTGSIFEESDGAIVYKGEKDGLHTRVFVNAEGLPTYEAKDIGLLEKKFLQYNPDLSLFVTDHEQREYFKVVLTAAGKINHIWQERSQHILHGRLGFSGIKISSRLGNVPLAEDILQAVHNTVLAKISSSDHTKVGADPDIIDTIAIGAVKFAILKTSLGKNITFDEKESLSFEGDSGPYLQYTYARIQSILRKASDAGIVQSCTHVSDDTVILERLLSLFPEKVLLATREYAPHHIANYLLELARAFNAYYAQVIIVSDDVYAPYRIVVARAVGQTVKNGLKLLGIETVKRM